jgi:hypothetical protein
MWQPYIPKLGVSPGCRVGVRNELENFQHVHFAQKYQDDASTKNNNMKTVPLAAKTSFEHGSVLPSSQNETSTRLLSECARACSLKQGLVPTVPEEIINNKPHKGLTSRQTFSIFSGQTIDSSPEHVTKRTNHFTVKPPNGLGCGMVPIHDQESGTRLRMRHPDVKGLSSLGPGLLPKGSQITVLSDVENKLEVTETYRRAYGKESRN